MRVNTTALDIPTRRLFSQHIPGTTFEKAEEVVKWLGAVQAQDYAAAKWAVAERTTGITDADVERAFNDGDILRTHLLRPTWHFITSVDIRWMLTLTAPRVHAANAYYHRQLAFDNDVFTRSNTALAKALQGGNQLTRVELVTVLKQAGITSSVSQGFTYLIMRAELDGILCSGARRGKQHTYALLDERAPQARSLEHDESLAELARRYFYSRGPATLDDYIWWSGLLASDAKAGLEMVRSQLLHEVIDSRTYWYAPSTPVTKDSSPTAYLLPNYDEYVVAYTDRTAIFDTPEFNKLDPRGNVVFNYIIVVDGQVAGTWKRTLKKNAVVLELKPFVPLTEAENRAVVAAAQRYSAFLGLPAVLI